MVSAGAHAPSEWTWQAYAQCRGTNADVFFPSLEEDPTPAKRVCDACPVRLACLGFALRNGEKYGIWGGLTERERSRLSAQEREEAIAEGRRAQRQLPAA